MLNEKIKPKHDGDPSISFDEAPERIHEGKWGVLHVYSGGSYLSVASLFDTEEEANRRAQGWLKGVRDNIAVTGRKISVFDDSFGKFLYVFNTDFKMLIPMPVKGDQ